MPLNEAFRSVNPNGIAGFSPRVARHELPLGGRVFDRTLKGFGTATNSFIN
jgi:hypothetical protein